MKIRHSIISIKHLFLNQFNLGSGILIVLVFAIWLALPARAGDDMTGGDMLHMQHIMTQAQAESLKPGDSMAMTCKKCKDVMVQTVTTNTSHIKMMTVGEKLTCPACEGTVTVVATGKGKGKNAEVKHVCSKCGDDAMFCSATKPGRGAMKDMDKDKK